MHCDALTVEGVAQVTRENLTAGGCLLQCFAAFVGTGGYPRFCALADEFDALCMRAGYHKVTRACEIKEDAVNALLTAEGGTFETLEELDGLYARGVRMAGLVWNTPTAAGYPNFPDYAGLCAGRVLPSVREETRGLTAFGRQAVEHMFARGMLVDISHASDKLFFEVAAYGRPFVVSHSNAAAVHDWARNLTDAQLKAVADCGGVIGLNFCMDFLSDDTSAEGQRRALLAHARHILSVAGEDILALGSDFDGIPPNSFIPDAAAMPRLLQLLADAFGSRVAEKIACGNFLRVFSEVCR